MALHGPSYRRYRRLLYSPRNGICVSLKFNSKCLSALSQDILVTSTGVEPAYNGLKDRPEVLRSSLTPWMGRQDSNLRLRDPEARALPSWLPSNKKTVWSGCVVNRTPDFLIPGQTPSHSATPRFTKFGTPGES